MRCECKRLRSDGDLHTVAWVPAVSTMVGVMGNMSRNRCGTRIFICGEERALQCVCVPLGVKGCEDGGCKQCRSCVRPCWCC